MTTTPNNSDLDDDDKLTPEQAQIVARVRWLMLTSGFATVLGIAVVVSIVGYRVFRTEGRSGAAAVQIAGQVSTPVLSTPVLSTPVLGPGPVEATARLAKGARVISVATAGDRIVVTIDVGGAPEVRIYDARTLSPEGRLRFVEEP
jgi:hypothetical protein